MESIYNEEEIEMKQITWILRHKILSTFIVIIIIVFPPLIINSLYKVDAPIELLNSEWEASDLLGYYGAILSTVATIVAIMWTISFTIDNQLMERKLSIRPYIQTKWSPVLTKNDLMFDTHSAVFIEQFNGCFMSSHEPTKLFSNEDANIYNRKKKYLLKYDLCNIGSGNAININISINSSLITQPFGIPMNECRTLVIVLEGNIYKDKNVPLVVKFDYNDVSMLAKYYQIEKFNLYRSKDGMLNMSQVGEDIMSPPTEVIKY
jgi:preprotein translocase subunit SecE